MATLSTQNNLSDLDAMLNDLNSSKYDPAKSISSAGYGDYYSDYYAEPDGSAPARPPPPSGYKQDKKSKKTEYRSDSANSTLRLPKAIKPPKLQHVLVGDKKRRRRFHDLVKAQPRDNDVMKAPDFPDDSDDYDYGDSHPAESIIPDLSDEEMDELDAGETPRGDKSMVIKTDHGDLKSNYHYLGFGLWENTGKTERPKPRRPSPPSPPPVEEPIWYNCTVAVESHKTSKELDDLVHALDGFDRMGRRDVEVGDAADGLPGCLGDLYEEFEKEDMSDMFRRAFLEKMALVDDDKRPRHKCYVCRELIMGRIITAMSHKFHPECFVCTYCRKEFKERSFKSDNELKPYCHECFEKLLGHFGSAHFKLKELP